MTDATIDAALRFVQRARDYQKTNPVKEAIIKVGRRNLRIQVPALNPKYAEGFLNAFYNRANSNELADCTIRIYDDADGQKTASFPFDESRLSATGQHTPSGDNSLKICVNPIIGSISVFHWTQQEISIWVRDFQSLPYWYIATPLRDEIAAFADRLGMDFIHAASLGHGDKGVCIVGRSGLGKSTTVLRGVVEGLQTVGDDFLLTDGKRLFGVYGRAKAMHDTQNFVFGLCKAVISGHNETKLIVDISQLGGDNALVPEMEIRAICIPTRNAGHILAQVKRMEILRELLVHTSIGIREVYPEGLQRLRTLTEGAPCWTWLIAGEEVVLKESIGMMLDAHE